MKNSDKPAFPFETKVAMDKQQDREFYGLTKREYFAALTMQGVLANSDTDTERLNFISKVSIAMADELLKQLNG